MASAVTTASHSPIRCETPGNVVQVVRRTERAALRFVLPHSHVPALDALSDELSKRHAWILESVLE